MWALNYYLTQLSLGCQSSYQQNSRQLETRCGRENHTRPRGPSESPDGVDPNIRRTRKTQRDGHNSGVKIWFLCSVSSTLSYANPWTTLSNPCNKLRGEYFSKKVFLRLPSCVFIMRRLFMRLSLSLCRCELFYIYMCTYVDVNLHMWVYNKNTYPHSCLRPFF